MTPNTKLAAWIKSTGLKKRYICEHMGINNSTLTRWLAGTTPLPAYREVIDAYAAGIGKPLPADVWENE